MKTPIILLLGLALSANFDSAAAELPTPQSTESSSLTGNGTNVVLLYGGGYKYEVSRAKLETLPDWSIASNSIPLLPQQAAQIALARYSSLHPTISNLEVRNIFMRRISCDGSKWMYHVQVDYPPMRPQDSPPTKMVIVFFDGTVVDPVIDPDASRRPRPAIPEPRR